MTFSQLFTDTFNRANSTSFGNGWTDPGAVGSIASMVGVTKSVNTNGTWNGNGIIYRPASDGNPRDGQVAIGFAAGQTTTSGASVYASLRLQYAASTSTHYLIGVNWGSGTLAAFTVTSGTLNAGTSIGGSQSFTYNSAHTYTLTASVVGANPTTVTATLVDTTTGTTVASLTGTDSTAALQSVTSGVFGLQNYSSTVGTTNNITSFTSYAYVTPATAVSVTGPASGVSGTASSAFTVSSNGTLASAVVVTPSDGGAGGTFTPATVTLAATSGAPSSGTFTYTPASTGTKTLSFTNNGSLTNPSNLTYNSTATGPITIGVTSPACLFSPGNWYGDTGRGGSVYRQSWNNGAWVEFVWTAAASGATAVLNIPSNSSSNRLSYFLNGVLTDNVAATGPVTITPIAGVVNTLKVYLRNSTQSNRWANGGTNTVQITGLTIDGGSTAGTAPTARPWALIVGDSITEGIAANAGADDNLYDYSFLVGQALDQLGFDNCVSACGYSGYLVTGDGAGTSGDVPAYYYVNNGTYSESSSRWDKIASGVSLLDSAGQLSSYGATGTPPAAIFINYGTNEALQSVSTSDLQIAVQKCIASLRAAAPSAAIIIAIPFGLQYTAKYTSQSYTTAIQAGVAAYKTANPLDSKVTLFNAGPTLAATIQNGIYINSDNVHPTQYGHALVAPMVSSAIASALTSSSGGKSYSFS